MSHSQVLHCLNGHCVITSLVAILDLQAENVASRKRCPRDLAISRARFLPEFHCHETNLRTNSRKDARRRMRFAGYEQKICRHTRNEDSIGVLIAVRNVIYVVRVSDVSMISRRFATIRPRKKVMSWRKMRNKSQSKRPLMPAHS